MIIAVALLAVFTIVTVVLARQGLWGSLVMLVNVLFAATLASGGYEWLAKQLKPLTEDSESLVYVLDFLAIWMIFCGIVLVAREITDRIAPTNVRFLKPVERFGAPVAAALVGWTMMAFTAATLHMAPVAPGDIPSQGMFFGVSPDWGWIAWARGATGRPPFGSRGFRFDQTKNFIEYYAHRRTQHERGDVPADEHEDAPAADAAP